MFADLTAESLPVQVPVLKPYVLSDIQMPLREQPAGVAELDSVDMIIDDNGTTIPTTPVPVSMMH